jgi:CubicO group peptidase (beta-lactamase class C family)
MRMSPDWVDFAINLPMHGDPGTQFSYCSCNSFLLSAILSAQIGESELEFARRRLFSPLGITSVIWPSDPKGRTHGWGDLHLLPMDMAKIGVLFLNDGKWKRRTLISSSWVKKSLTAQLQAKPGMGYGYGWWINENLHPPGFEAAGRGGQQIAVLPAYDAAIVFTGGGFDAGKISPFLLRSMTASRSLPDNSGSLQELREQLRLASQQTEGPSPQETPLPAMARYASDGSTCFL